LALLSGHVSGQERDTLSAQTLGSDTLRHVLPDLPEKTGNHVADNQETEPPLSDTASIVQDSVPKIVVVGLTDPLDTLSNKIFAYQILDRNSYARIQTVIDTTLSRFEINNPVMRHYFAGTYLGNAGLSYYPIGFEARKRPSDFLFTDHVALYMHIPEETMYYQTQMPYTLLNYSSAGAKSVNESILSVVHTQNVNKQWNVGLHYDITASVGYYTNQNTSDHAFSLFSAYRGNQYSMYANFNWNNIRMRENGGLANINDFYDNDYASQTNVMRSQAGKTVMVNRSFYVMQTYAPKQLRLFGRNATPDSVNVSRFTLVHTFKYEWTKREFSDTAAYVRRLQGALPLQMPYFGQISTHDSLYFRRIFNHFELMIKEQARNRFTAGFSIGILNEMDRYNNNIIPVINSVNHGEYTPPANGWSGSLPLMNWQETVITYRGTERYFNTAITGRFFNHTGRYLNWDFNGRFYFTGYKPGNLNINGTVQLHYYTSGGKNTLLLGGSIENARPSYFLNRYTSNWLVWDNDFDMSQEIRLHGEFLMPHRKFKAGLYLSQLNRYVYIDRQAMPQQTQDLVMVTTAFLEKDLKWWKLHFLFRLYGQHSSHDIVPLPAFAGYQSTYFEGWLVRNVLNMQLGWDVVYHTKYYAYAYMPSSGMFYLQDEQKIGGYPFTDVFLNFQLKRARIFVKAENISALLTQPLGKEYFMAYRYPLPEFRVKFGISWAFYD
jgi:hypothetical protein